MQLTSFDAAASEAKARRLLALHGTPPLRLLNVWDAGSAEIIASLPFTKALASASYAVAGAAGLKDAELTADVNLETLKRIGAVAQRHNLPFTADLQHGYGEDLESVFDEAIRKANVVGCNLEDLLADESGLLSMEGACKRIKRVRAVAIKLGVPSFVINARIDALNYGGTIDEVIQRGRAYLESGASFIFVWRWGAGLSREDVTALVAALGAKVDTVVCKGGLSSNQLGEMGVCRLSIGPAIWVDVNEVISQRAQHVMQGGAL